MGKNIDRAVFPGLQGGPHNNQTAGIAVALGEAGAAKFKKYGQSVVANAKVMAEELTKLGFEISSGGTDNHLMLVDLRPKNLLGKPFAVALEQAGIVTNYNAVPNDPNPPFNPSGIRIGTPGVTTRGMGVKQMKMIAGWMAQVAENMEDEKVLKKINREVKKLCREFPIR
jgi:glycine hydroxymethyltransferase